MENSYQFLEELLKQNDKVVVAVSGGPDFMALLNLLLEIKQEKNIYESPLKESMEIIIRQIIWNNYIFIIDMRTIFVYKVDYQKINEYLLDYLKNLKEKE